MFIARISYFLVFVTSSLSQTLTGDYVCSRMENYTVSTRETYMVPLQIFEVEWCFAFPPRCPRKKDVMREKSEIKTELKTRIVHECCKGYVRHETNTSNVYCIPHCDKCEHGTCVAPNICECKPGYRGSDCSDECPSGLWGQHCMQKCKCTLNSICNSTNGSCECLPGWQGYGCDEKCPEGKWGINCQQICLCENADGKCDPVNGECYLNNNEEIKKIYTVRKMEDAVKLSHQIIESTGIFTPTNIYESTQSLDSDIYQSNMENNSQENTENMNENMNLSTVQNGDSVTNASQTNVGSNHERPVTEKTVDSISKNNDRKVEHAENNLDRPKLKITEKETIIPHVIFSPESDFVKTISKEPSNPMPIPIDVAVLIVIGSMISLSLTSVAALMIFHMRSRLIKAVRMSVYPTDKCDNPQSDVNCSTLPTKCIHANTLPRAAPRMTSLVITPEPKSVLTLERHSTANEYANGTVTIDFHSFRDLMEGHYDRPTSSYQRNEDHAEHVYDEIPLSTAFCVNKKT